MAIKEGTFSPPKFSRRAFLFGAGATIAAGIAAKLALPQESGSSAQTLVSHDGDTTVKTDLNASTVAQKTTEPKSAAIDFELEGQDGKKIRLSNFRGKPVVIAFFYTTEPFTFKALTLLEENLWPKYKEGEVQFLAIALSSNRSMIQKNLKLDKRTPFPFPILADPDSESNLEFDIRVLPSYFVIDRNGVNLTSGIVSAKPELLPDLIQKAINSH